MTLCLDAQLAEAAVVVVEGDSLYDAGNLLGRGSALWHRGGHSWGFILPSAESEQVCLKGSPDWYVIKSGAETTTINHINFKTFEIGDNWTGHGQIGPAYRTFHNGKCYELGIQNVFSRAEYDPGTVKEFTKKDSSEVERRLRQALNSFVFLK